MIRSRRAATSLLIGSGSVVAAGCVVAGAGYGYGSDVRIGVDYYDPAYEDYSAWGPAYPVAPYRGQVSRPERTGGRDAQRPYTPAPAARAIPSLPARPRARGTQPQR